MMSKPNLFCIYALLLCLAGHAAQPPSGGHTVKGIIFEDRNGNGVRDPGEKGISGVAVSDQVNIVISDSGGIYRLPAASGYGILFVSLPDGYGSTRPFWQQIDTARDQDHIDFPLVRTKLQDHFTFVHASDTHVSGQSLDRMQKFRKILDSLQPDLVIITGDLVKDALRVPETEARTCYELFQSERNKIRTTVWTIPGNHEIFGIERHLSLVSTKNPLYGRNMYRHYFGPDYYSFNYGGVHFVGLNSLDFEDLWYYGKIDSIQLAWLKKDLSLVDPATPVITFQHVPFYSGGLSLQPFEESGPGRVLEIEQGVKQYRHIVSNAGDVIALLSGHNYPLALAGHYHYQQKFSMAGVATRFEQTAAIIAPSSEGSLNMPSGLVLYTVNKGRIDEGKFIYMDPH